MKPEGLDSSSTRKLHTEIERCQQRLVEKKHHLHSYYGTIEGAQRDWMDTMDAAEALGSRNTLPELVNEKHGLSPDRAVSLSKVFGGNADGSLVQQAQNDLAHARVDRIKPKRLDFANV